MLPGDGLLFGGLEQKFAETRKLLLLWLDAFEEVHCRREEIQGAV